MNAHGLQRTISEATMREVRQRCGFGCVVCGCAIIQYYHFAPEHADATEHRSGGITLLCGICYDRTTKGIIGPGQIEYFDAHPRCKQKGFTHDFLFASRDKFTFQMGTAKFRGHVILQYDDEILIGFAPPDSGTGPAQLCARVEDDSGQPLLDIDRNFWRVGTQHFDVETFGTALVIRRKPGDILLSMRLNADEIVLEKLKMSHRGFRISVQQGWLEIDPANGTGPVRMRYVDIKSGIHLNSDGTCSLGSVFPWDRQRQVEQLSCTRPGTL